MKRKTKLPRLLTAQELAAYLRLPRRTVYEYARTGRLPSLRLGRSGRLLRFDRQAIEEWLRARQALKKPNNRA